MDATPAMFRKYLADRILNRMLRPDVNEEPRLNVSKGPPQHDVLKVLGAGQNTHLSKNFLTVHSVGCDRI